MKYKAEIKTYDKTGLRIHLAHPCNSIIEAWKWLDDNYGRYVLVPWNDNKLVNFFVRILSRVDVLYTVQPNSPTVGEDIVCWFCGNFLEIFSKETQQTAFVYTKIMHEYFQFKLDQEQNGEIKEE